MVLFARPAFDGKQAVRGGADARELVEKFPRPALLLAKTGAITAASPSGDALIAATADEVGENSSKSAGWWHKLTAWLFESDLERTTSLATTIPGVGEDGADMLLEWQAIALSDGAIVVLAQDNSLHHTLNQALADSRQRFRELTELTADFAWESDAAGFLAYVSSGRALGYASRELIGRPAHRVLAAQMNEGISPFETRVDISAKDVWMMRADGEMVTQTVWARPIFDGNGNWRGARGVCRDVSRSRRLEQQIARAQLRERLLTHILKSMRDELRPENSLATAAQATAHAIAADGSVVFRNCFEGSCTPVATFSVLPPGKEITERLAEQLPDLIAIEDVPTGQPARARIEGAEAMVSVSRFRGRPVGLLAVWRRTNGQRQVCIWDEDDGHVIQSVADQLGLAHEQMAHYEELEDLAQRDGLTGLYNRRTLLDHVGRDFANNRIDQMQAIAYLDIDNFKGVNDHYGHQEGDLIIQEVAKILSGLAGPKDVAARIGGDEFVIWLGDTNDMVIDELAQVVQAGGREIAGRYIDVDPPGISVGIAIRDPESEESLESMIARADQAMYEAKRTKSQVRGGRVRISTRAD